MAVDANRARVALVEEDKKWTFGELAAEVDSIAGMLREKVPGDTVGILLLNSERYVATLLAVWKAGKTAVPLNYLLPPQELAFIIRDSGMSALVSSQFFAQALAAVKPLFGDKGVILMADAPDFTHSSASAARKHEYQKPCALPVYVGDDGAAERSHPDASESAAQCRRVRKGRRVRCTRRISLSASVLSHLRDHGDDTAATVERLQHGAGGSIPSA